MQAVIPRMEVLSKFWCWSLKCSFLRIEISEGRRASRVYHLQCRTRCHGSKCRKYKNFVVYAKMWIFVSTNLSYGNWGETERHLREWSFFRERDSSRHKWQAYIWPFGGPFHGIIYNKEFMGFHIEVSSIGSLVKFLTCVLFSSILVVCMKSGNKIYCTWK